MSASGREGRATRQSKTGEKDSSAPRGHKTNPSRPARSPVDQISLLQRTIGNRAVERLLKSGVVQAKLKVNEPRDIYEQEADRIADQVMATPTHPALNGAPPRIQRFSRQSNGLDPAPASVDQTLASPGRPLEPALQQDMAQRFGHDFSKVRLHSGTAAQQSAQDVNAIAYTMGHDIVFGAGRFAPGTHEGRRLLAHELTHVVQQSGSGGIHVDSSNEKRGLSAPVRSEKASNFLSVRRVGGNSGVGGLIQRQPIEAPKPSRRGRTEEERLWPVMLSDGHTLPEAIKDFVPRILSAINGARFKPVRGSRHARGATQEEALWKGTVSIAKLFARDVIYNFSGSATLLEVESNLSRPVDPANPDELPAPKFPLPPEGLVLISEPATKRIWQMFQQTGGRFEMLPFAGKLSLPEGMGAGQLLVFIYAPGHSASEDGGPQPGYKAKDLKGEAAEVPGWAKSQYSRAKRLLEGRVESRGPGAKAPSGTGTGRAGEGTGGGGKDPLGHGTGVAGTGSGAAIPVGGKGRGGDTQPRDRAKPDKVALYMGKRGPTLNVWKGGSHEAIQLKAGESDEDLTRRIEEAAARQQSTGERIADGATVTGVVGGQGGAKATAEEIAEATEFTANASAYPSRMEMQGGSGAEVSPNGWGTTITGAKHNFDMILDWDARHFGLANQVFARLGWVDYFWQVIDISKLDLGAESGTKGEFEQEDAFRQRMRRQARIGAQDPTKVRKATEMEGFKETVSDVASVKWEEAKEDAPDIAAADSIVTWPAKASQLSVIAVDMAWSIGKALISAWVTKMTEPENRREIAFGHPGEFLIRCLANPHPDEDKPYERQTRRATSIAVFPVRVVDVKSRAQEVTREDKSQLERAQMLVADLQKKLAADPTNEELRNALEIAQFMLDNQQASYGWSTVEKVGHELESYDKQIAVLEKLKYPKSSIADLKGEERTIALDLKEEISKRLKRGPNGFVAWYDYEFHLHDVKEARKKKAEQKKLTEKKAETVAPGTALRPRVAFVSEENGALVRMEMILGRAKGSSSEKPKWVLADVTTPDTARSYEGSASKAGAEGDREAVAKAFEAFAEKAEYGRGTISIEIPGREDLIATGKTMLMKPGEGLRWRGRLRSLIEIAGMVAPYVKGGQLIGRIAAIGGALDAGERLYDRAVNDRLKANFETLADVVTVLAPMAHGATALSARLPRSSSGAYVLRTVGKTIDYANEFMMPATFVHDLDQIVRDTSLGGPEKKAAIAMLFGRGLRDGIVQYVKVTGAHRVGTPEPGAPVAGRTAETPVGEGVRPVVGRTVPMEGGAPSARELTPRQGGAHEKFDLSDVGGPTEAAPKETRSRPTETQGPRPAEADKPPGPAPDTGQQPAKGQEPKAGEAGSTLDTARNRANRQEQSRRAEVWQVDAATIELGTRPDARARARAAEFAPTFAEWGALGAPGRKVRIESLINALLAREGIPPVKVKWGNKAPGAAEFAFHEWSITLSERAIGADRISVEDFATLVDNAVHEGRHAVTTFRGMRVALADNNYNPNAPIPGRILAHAIEANRRKSPSAELSAEALGEAREIYEVGFAQDQRRAALGTEGVVDREAVYERKKAATDQLSDAKVLHEFNVDEVKRLEAAGKSGSAEHAEAQRNAADSYQAWLRAYREQVAAHNEYVALPEETESWRMGSAVKAAVLERLALQSRLTDLRQQQKQATVEQRRKRQGGDRKGAAEALAKSLEAQREIRKTQAEIDALVSKEPKLVGGRIAKQDQPLSPGEIARAASEAEAAVKPAPPGPTIVKPPPVTPAATAPVQPPPAGEKPPASKGSVPKKTPATPPPLTVISRYGSRAKLVEAVTQKLGTDIHPRPPGWERVIEALKANPGPNNTEILAKIEKVMDALQDPKLYGEVLGDAWDLVKAGEAANINDALLKMAKGSGLPVKTIREVMPADKFFEQVATEGAYWVDEPLGDEAKQAHGKMTHLLQDLVVNKALGGPRASAEFRQLLRKAEGTVDRYVWQGEKLVPSRFAQLPGNNKPLPNTVFVDKTTGGVVETEYSMQTGDYVWRFMYDLFYKGGEELKTYGRLPQPEVLRPLLNKLKDIDLK